MAEKMEIVHSEKLGTNSAPIMGGFNWQFLVQGDSWFSTSTLKPWSRSNLLEQMEFPQRAIAINCADPGDTLAHMVEWRRDPLFFACLAGPRQMPWSAIFLSAGGNDLIDAVQVPAVGDDQVPMAPHERLLLTSTEWGGVLASNDNKYISAQGWENFANHLVLQFKALDFIRSTSTDNKNTPIFTHTYDYATPRASGAGLKLGPWLLPALKTYQIPEDDWNALADAFIDKLAAVVMNLNLPNFHVVDTRRTLTRADRSATGESNDWENEIHPTADGYRKLAPLLVSRVCKVLNIPAATLQPALAAATDALPAAASVAAMRQTPAAGSAHH